jgi:tetratricopeptide (TPR) repeat protein
LLYITCYRLLRAQLNVELLLDGVFQKANDQIRVSVQLIRASDGVTFWATKFDEHFTNLFAIEDSIAEQVAQALELELSAEEQRQLRRNSPVSVEAHHLYIKGRYFWNQRTLEGLKKCFDYAQQTIAMDPTYAPAYIGVADSYNLLSGHGGLAPKDTFPKAKAAALAALELDPTLGEAYASLGFVNYRFEWNWPEAEENFLTAIRIKPNYSTAHHWYGEALASAGRFEESLAALERAEQLDPLSLPINTDLAQTLFFARRYEECEKQLRKTLEMDSHFIRAHIILGAALERMRKYDEAVASLTRAVTLSKRNSFAVSGLAHVHAVMGNKPAANEALRYLEELASQRYSSPYNRALVHAGLGQKEEALTLLESAVAERDVWLVWLGVNPRFDSLRSEPGFSDLLRRVVPEQLTRDLALAQSDA